MAILITNSTPFKPMSFDEMIKPHLLATEAYNEIEKGIADLDAEAESMRQIAQREIDAAQAEGREAKPFATEYMNYADSLDAKAEELATKGLRHVSRKDLYNLQSQYKTKVKPIEDADKYIKEMAKEQRLLNKDGNTVFDRDFSNGVSIQDVIDNPALGYTPYSLEDIAKNSAMNAAVIKSGMDYIDDEHTINDPYYYTHQGVDGELLDAWQRKANKVGTKDANGQVIQLNQQEQYLEEVAKQQVAHLKGVLPEEAYKRALSKAREGIATGIADVPTKTTNVEYMTPSQRIQEARNNMQWKKFLEENNLVEKDGNLEYTALGKLLKQAQQAETISELNDYFISTQKKQLEFGEDGMPLTDGDGKYRLKDMSDTQYAEWYSRYTKKNQPQGQKTEEETSEYYENSRRTFNYTYDGEGNSVDLEEPDLSPDSGWELIDGYEKLPRDIKDKVNKDIENHNKSLPMNEKIQPSDVEVYVKNSDKKDGKKRYTIRYKQDDYSGTFG